MIYNLMRLSRFLGLTEFIVAFFVMAFAASLPNLFVGITSAIQGIPELSLGDIFGNNFTALTLAVAVGVFFSPKQEITIESQTIRTSSGFTFIAALLPLILLIDGNLGRSDGIILIGFFIFYMVWLISRRDNFSKIYREKLTPVFGFKHAKTAFISLGKIILGIILIFLASHGIVFSASFFAIHLGMPLALVGLLIVGFGNALPEVYFSIASARRGETFMILGNLLGSVIIPATFILGIVAIIHPIFIGNSVSLFLSRSFLVAAACFFFFFSKTHSKITKHEAVVLMLVYVAFLASIVLIR